MKGTGKIMSNGGMVLFGYWTREEIIRDNMLESGKIISIMDLDRISMMIRDMMESGRIVKKTDLGD